MQHDSIIEELAVLTSQPSSGCEVRHDTIHRWPVIYAPQRANRPFDFSKRKTVNCGENDPFAENRESETTAETYAIRESGSEPNSPGWQVRIVPNKYPALDSASEIAPVQIDAQGVHEVIIECPQSETHFTRLPLPQVQLVFQSYRDRLQQLADSENTVHATIFKNHGPNAGASLAHTHSQLLATSFVPPLIQSELSFVTDHFERTGGDFFDQLIAEEIACGKRLVQQTEDFVVFCPNASRFSFEMQIYPRISQSHFHLTNDILLNSLAEVMLQSLKRLEAVAAFPDYNFVLHSAPFHRQQSPGFRWHWEIYPRITGIAGWEMGAGSYVNPLFPENAAKQLREAI